MRQIGPGVIQNAAQALRREGSTEQIGAPERPPDATSALPAPLQDHFGFLLSRMGVERPFSSARAATCKLHLHGQHPICATINKAGRELFSRQGQALTFNTLMYGGVYQTPHSDGGDIALAALILSVPITSLVALCFDNSAGWISLYFKRKTMEEKAKISRLTGKNL